MKCSVNHQLCRCQWKREAPSEEIQANLFVTLTGEDASE